MVYFDNASTTYPKPSRMVDELKKAVLLYAGNPGRSGHDISMRTSEKVYDIRFKVAKFFGSEIENVIFTSNCTHSLNIAIKGTIKQGNIIISCFEHNSVTRPIYSLKDKNISCTVADVYDKDDNEIVDEFSKHIKSDTKAIVCTHASNVIGSILPIRKIGELCRSKNIIFIVDAAQTAGVIDIDMNRDNIDILCLSGHKGMYGCTGTGLMIIGNNSKLNIDPIIQGGTGSGSIDIRQPDFTPDRFESGTLNTLGIISLDAGLNFLKEKEIEKIYNHEFLLCKTVYDNFKKMGNIKLYNNNFKYDKSVPIVAFNVEGYKSMKTVGYLNDNGFALRGGLHCSFLCHDRLKTTETGIARFSPSTFNTSNEIENFISCVKKM